MDSSNANPGYHPRRLLKVSPGAALSSLWLTIGLALTMLAIPAQTDRARVVAVHHPNATREFTPQPAQLRPMLERGLTVLTTEPVPSDAWHSLLPLTNRIGIKVHAAPGPLVGTRPSVVEALIQSLLDAGYPAGQISIWDKRLRDLHAAGYLDLANRYRIQLAGALDSGWDPEAIYENSLLGTPVWGDLEFEQTGEKAGRNSYISKLLTEQLDAVIQIAPLLNHNLAGTHGHLFTAAMASADNTRRFEHSADVMATGVPELFAREEIGDKFVLHITDALIGQYESGHRLALHYAQAVNELWLSADPVALDVLAVLHLSDLREKGGMRPQKTSWQLYENAALLQLGQDDPKRIALTRLKAGPQETGR